MQGLWLCADKARSKGVILSHLLCLFALKVLSHSQDRLPDTCHRDLVAVLAPAASCGKQVVKSSLFYQPPWGGVGEDHRALLLWAEGTLHTQVASWCWHRLHAAWDWPLCSAASPWRLRGAWVASLRGEEEEEPEVKVDSLLVVLKMAGVHLGPSNTLRELSLPPEIYRQKPEEDSQLWGARRTWPSELITPQNRRKSTSYEITFCVETTHTHKHISIIKVKKLTEKNWIKREAYFSETTLWNQSQE